MNLNLYFEKIHWQIILILFAGFFFAWNLLMPFFADDILYAFIWDAEHGGNFSPNVGKLERISSFTDILVSQWLHYFHWGGRTVAHIIVQFFSWIGNFYFDVINVFAFCALIFLIFKIATGLTLRDMNKKYLLFVLFAVYFFTPSFLMTMVWMDGAINYMWMVTLELIFILPFALRYRDKNFWNKSNIWQIILMALVGLIAGWSSEPGASLTMFVTFFFLIKFWREGNLTKWMLTGFLFLIIGFLLVTFAPGNDEQLQFLNLQPNASNYTFDAFAYRFETAFFPIIFRESVLFLPIIFYFVQGQRNFDATIFILIFMAASVVTLSVLMFLPYFPERTGSPTTFFLLIASVAALKEILPNLEKIYKRHAKILSLAAKILCVAWILHLSACTYVYYDVHTQFVNRWEIINQNRDAEEIIVPHLVIPNWSEKIIGERTWTQEAVFLGDIQSTYENTRYITFSQYYGLKKIRTE